MMGLDLAAALLLCVVREVWREMDVWRRKEKKRERATGGVIAGTCSVFFGLVEIDEGLDLETLISHNQGP